MAVSRICLLGLFFAWWWPASAEDISLTGWRLWPDRQASWQNDTLYLPSEVNLAQISVNPPSGGWQVLDDAHGISVTLPSTVEEHYWGKFGTRPYGPYETQKGAETAFPNGAYQGVSWWWRDIQVPDFKAGQRVVVSFRGARLRSEVYCNSKLCGYSIMTELPFQADLTDAVRPGQKAQLAVRITNPGGGYDWIDFSMARFQWGKYTFPPSHGFGGLDSNIQLQVRDNVSITDVAAINKKDLHQVHLEADVTSVSQKYQGPVHFKISRDGKTVWAGDASVDLAPGETKTVGIEAQVDSALLWSVEHPNLYQAEASLGEPESAKSVNFGFRYFTAEGIGSSDAKLTLNGKRIVVVSAISWGFWGRNGLWPDRQMAQREVSDAKALGMNCLTFHRTIGKPEVLDLQDREGLLRYEEPGGGKFALGARYAQGPFGPNGEFLAPPGDNRDAFQFRAGYNEPDTIDTSGSGPDGDPIVFWEKYEQEKILEMVKRDRSHPSLIIYGIQNESAQVDLSNPRIYRLMRAMHALDPSRIIVLFSGNGVPNQSQALMLPYSDQISYGSKTIPYAGWKDTHTCGGPCNYLDDLYTDPLHFVQRQQPEDRKEICVWGEILGAAVPDDYDKVVHSFDAAHPTGYELADMTKILAGYHDFLDRWGFRRAFPTDSSLFQAIGYRCYYFWQRILEQSRADDANDMLVMSGWESTTIDNHSGLVDNHRFFKGDPKVIAKALQPEMIFIQPRHMIVARGEKDLVDVFLLNESNRSGAQTLKFTARNPNGSVAFTTKRPVTAIGGDVYGQLLAEGIEIPAPAAGMLKLEATLTAQQPGTAPLTGTDRVEVIDVAGKPLFQNVAVVEPDHEIAQTLKNIFQVTPADFAHTPATTHLDAIVLGTKGEDSDLFAVPKLVPPSTATTTPPVPDISSETFTEALRRAHDDGTRLVLWPDNNFRAMAFAQELARRKIVTYAGTVGSLEAPWFGTWYFVRKHWLLKGLPTDCAMDWRYGISAFGGPSWNRVDPPGAHCDGLLLNAPGMEVFAGYGADHNTKVGVAGCVIPYGRGEIVLYCLPQLVQSLQSGDCAINQVIAQRLLGDALSPVADSP